MADWFETRFREPVDSERLDPAFAARVRALVVEEWQADAGSTPLDDTDADDRGGHIIMLEIEDHPTTGDEPEPPRRGSPGRWLLVAAAVALVALVGALLAAGGDDETEIDTATSVSTPNAPTDILSLEEGLQYLEPGRYSIDPDGDPSTPLTVVYEVAAEGWSPWIGAAKFNDDGHVGLSITTVDNLVREGCRDQAPQNPAVGPTVDDLATALSALGPFVVSAPPTDVTLLGYPGKHLQLTVPDLPVSGFGNNRVFKDCLGRDLLSWIAPNLGGAFHGYNGEPGRTEDFWILDVDGTRLVIETNQSPETPSQDLAEQEAILDSIRIQP